MATSEYPSQLWFFPNPEKGKAKRAGKRVVIPIDLASAPSKMEAILSAIRAARGEPRLIEQYALSLEDDNDLVFMTLNATAAQLQRHQDGYPVNVDAGSVPPALGDFTNDELMGELYRRLGS
jgi:hypothetical protein